MFTETQGGTIDLKKKKTNVIRYGNKKNKMLVVTFGIAVELLFRALQHRVVLVIELGLQQVRDDLVVAGVTRVVRFSRVDLRFAHVVLVELLPQFPGDITK